MISNEELIKMIIPNLKSSNRVREYNSYNGKEKDVARGSLCFPLTSPRPRKLPIK